MNTGDLRRSPYGRYGRTRYSPMTSAERSQPTYRRIIDDLAGRIARRELQPGDALPTRIELAAEYGAARATIDKALGELQREGKIEAGSGRRTIVADAPIQALKSLAVIWNWTPEQERLGGDYLDGLFKGVREACSEYQLNVHFRRTPLHGALELLESTNAEGLLVIRPDYADAPTIDAICAAGHPVVVAPAVMEISNAMCIATDNAGGVELAISHLRSLGHHEIGFVDFTATLPDHFERLQAFLTVAARHNLTVRPEWIFLCHETDPRQFDRVVADWHPASWPTALLCGDFVMGLATMHHLKEFGLSVPNDLSVVTFDDPPAATQIDPPLTTVAQPIPRIGFRAVERLIELASGEHPPCLERVATELRVRRSTRPLEAPIAPST